MDLKNKSKELAEIIKSTREFAELKQARINIEKDSGLKSQVEEFNRQQMAFLSGKFSGKDADSKAAELDNKFKTISRVPEADRYLKASKQFNDMMYGIYKSINDTIDSALKSK